MRALRGARRCPPLLRAQRERWPELVFIPGWCCDHTAFQLQFDHFARSHWVTAIDLRGVGRSEVTDGGYSIPELAEDVVALCRELQIEKPVLVGHSLGGMIAVELGGRHPSLPRALVLVDPGPIDPLPATTEFFRGAAKGLEGPNGEEVRREYVSDMGARDEELASWIVEHTCHPPQPVAAAVIRGVSEWIGHEPFRRCTAPVLLLRDEVGPEHRPAATPGDEARPPDRDHGGSRAFPAARGARAGERDDRALPRAVALSTPTA